MQVVVVIEALDPPRGHGVVDGRAAWTFVGWMELIQKVEELKHEGGDPRAETESASVP